MFTYGGLSGNSSIYYIENPDGDGIWKDADKDGIADVIDLLPHTPDSGVKEEPINWVSNLKVWLAVGVVIVASLIGFWMWLKIKRKEG